MGRDDYPPDWQKRRISTFQRNGWECQKCGYEHSADSDSSLHAHHITPISEGGGHSLDNLVALCEECHRAVHTNGITPPIPDSYDCSYCGRTRREDQMYAGSYCSEICWARHQAERATNALNNTAGICSTCFSNFPSNEDVCPSCGNWEPNENHRDELQPVEIDVIGLLSFVISEREA